MIGDGEGEVDGSDIKEAVPENVVDKSNSAALAEAPINFTVVQKIPQFPEDGLFLCNGLQKT